MRTDNYIDNVKHSACKYKENNKSVRVEEKNVDLLKELIDRLFERIIQQK